MDGDRLHGTAGRPGTEGSSKIYVILLVALLSVLSSGYMAISRYNMKAALLNRNYMEAQMMAKSIHRSFSEAVSAGDSDAMNYLWDCFGQDCDAVRQEYEEMMDREPEEGGTDEDDGGGEASEEDADGRWERYLHQKLGHKEYEILGQASEAGLAGAAPASTGGEAAAASTDPDLQIDIRLTAMPLDGTACVHTKVAYKGFHFSMMADIVFNDSDGAVMTIRKPGPHRSRVSDGDTQVYLNGNGVYRYYEDEED